MEIRHARIDDAEAIRHIYNLEVETSTATFDLEPRSLADQRAWLAAHGGAHPCLVAIDSASVAGFASLSPYRPRPAYTTTAEDSIYVARDHHRQGVGRLLLTGLIDRAVAHGFHTIMARISDSQAASVALHRALGYEVVGIERQVGRKFGRWLDVVVMQLMLDQRPPHVSP